jgi:peptidoglycan/LPS O-acetylase OafA/YrhL
MPAPENRPASSGRLDNLQMLRALAASTVVVLHAFHETEAIGQATGRPAAVLGGHFAFGVDVFFALSGFIMAHTAAGEFEAPGASLRFFLRRCARVVPLYWLLTTVLLVGGIAAPALLNAPLGDAFHVVASYLFIPDPRGAGEMRPVIALGWTLNYEMLFYVMFAIAMLLPLRLGIAWLSVQMATMAVGHGFLDPVHVRAAFWTDPIILEFLFGVYVGLMLRAGWRIGRAAALALAVAGLSGFVGLGDRVEAAPAFLRFGLPAAMLVAAGALGPATPRSRLTAAAVALGDASYSLYLVHPFALRPARLAWTKLVGGQAPSVAFVPVAVAAAVVVGLLLYRLVERPLTSRAQALLRPAGRSGGPAAERARAASEVA